MNIVESAERADLWTKSTPSSTTWAARIRSHDFIELAGVFTLILLALWTPHPARSIVGWLALLWIVVATLRSRPSAAELGLRLAGARQSLWVPGVALILAAIATWISWNMRTLHAVLHGFPAWAGFSTYIFWTLLQQFILQDFFLRRLLRLLPTKTAAIVTAGLMFAAAHVPNPLLMVLTLVWGVAACGLFLRYRNLFTLALAHALLGVSLAITVPNSIHHQMRVGLSYFRWHSQMQPIHRSQMDHMVSTEAWVIAEATSRRSSLHALP